MALHPPVGALSVQRRQGISCAKSIRCSRGPRSFSSTRSSRIRRTSGWSPARPTRRRISRPAPATVRSTTISSTPTCPAPRSAPVRRSTWVLLGTCSPPASRAGKSSGWTRSSANRSPRRAQRLAPMQIGSLGQIQEWLEDWGVLEQKHRHISHLYGLYPEQPDHPGGNARTGAGGQGRAQPARRCRHRLRHGVEGRLLGAPLRWRPRAALPV